MRAVREHLLLQWIWALLAVCVRTDKGGGLLSKSGQARTVKPVTRAVFLGWQIALEESRGAKSKSLFHTIIITQLMCVREKIELSSILQRPRLSSTKILGDLSLTIKINQ